ncbi:MAG: nucleotidyltransferase family protein [Elusimicrobiales bacterium]|nr:nucleotidyltransferase family protein [Elusimicrobiales bacterium]
MPARNYEDVETALHSRMDVLRGKYHVKKIGVFGSFAQGRQTAKSDVDILVSFSVPIGLFHFVRTEKYIRGVLGRKVDIATQAALKPEIKHSVLGEVRYIS